MTKLNVLSVLSVLTLLFGTKSEHVNRESRSNGKHGLSLIDNLKVESLKTFVSLWQDITERNDANSQMTSDISVLRAFQKLSQNITKAEDLINRSDNYLFSSEWSYALVDAEIFNINTYYETFLRFQEENLKGIRKPPLAWTDLAATYLQKSDYGVFKSLEKIHRYTATDIESNNLFKKACKVTHA